MNTVCDMVAFLGERVLGRGGRAQACWSGALMPLSGAPQPGGLAFARGTGVQVEAAVAASGASVVLCEPALVRALHGRAGIPALVAVANPRLEFARVAACRGHEAASAGVDPAASVSPGASVAAGVRVAPRAVVEAGARLGENCVVGPGAVVGSGVRIGARVMVAGGAVLGDAGFGFERDLDGRLVRVPQCGGVLVGNDVEIGANSCVDRGTFGDTVIGEGSKLDDLCYVAHNVTVGRHCLVMAGVRILGSARIGDRAEIAPGAVVRDHCTVGEGARVGMGAVVARDVADGDTVAGVPARPLAARS